MDIMNIKRYTVSTDFSDHTPTASAAGTQKTAAAFEAGNYDRVSLNKSAYPANDTSFARVLAREAASRIGNGAGRDKVLSIKQQIQDGTYMPDSRRIAERILGYR